MFQHNINIKFVNAAIICPIFCAQRDSRWFDGSYVPQNFDGQEKNVFMFSPCRTGAIKWIGELFARSPDREMRFKSFLINEIFTVKSGREWIKLIQMVAMEFFPLFSRRWMQSAMQLIKFYDQFYCKFVIKIISRCCGLKQLNSG